MPSDYLDQNIKFAIPFIIFLSGPILLSILFVLIDQINSLLPMGVLVYPAELLFIDGGMSGCFKINNWSFYNLLAFNIEYF